MAIPDDLKIFSLIFEYRFFVLIPFYAVWLLGSCYLLFRLKKMFFLWLLLFPLVLSPLHIATTWCGWHYRMELRNRFAQTDRGWSDEFTRDHSIDIDRMPPKIRAEYAKHNYHPRFRDMKAMVVGTIVFTPLLYASGGLVFLLIAFIKQWLKRRKKADTTA